MKFRRFFEIYFPMYHSFPFHILGQPRYSLLRRRRRRRRHAGGGGRSPESPSRKSGNEGKKVRDFRQKKLKVFCETFVKATQTYDTNRKKKSFFLYLDWLSSIPTPTKTQVCCSFVLLQKRDMWKTKAVVVLFVVWGRS